MKVSIIGTGYVGLVTGACLADVGNDVVCVDLDAGKLAALRAGNVTIYEPGLTEMVRANMAAGRLSFTGDIAEAAAHGTIQFIAVGTPPGSDGAADLSHVLKAAADLGRHMRDYRVIVNKSTVPVGTGDAVRAAVARELEARGVSIPFSVVSNPEFLKEGSAVQDFMRPDRLIIGADSERAIQLMRMLYAPLQRNHDRLIVMDVRSAELTKYAANAMLATRISFMNEMANLAEVLGADIERVRVGIGSDPRIGYDFLYPGCGYGGSCFPKDVKALIKTAAEQGGRLRILDAVETVNETQKLRLPEKIVARFGQDLSGHTFALWGLAFKPNTDDMRQAPSREIVTALLERGARIRAYDPVAMESARAVFGPVAAIDYVDSPLSALQAASALIIVTEWKQFRSPEFSDMKALLRHPVVFDGRNLYEPSLVREFGLEYHAVGRP